MFADAGMVCITAFISPYARIATWCARCAPGKFLEVYLNAPLEVCEQRDPKGLYAKAPAESRIHGHFLAFEPPLRAEIKLHTEPQHRRGMRWQRFWLS